MTQNQREKQNNTLQCSTDVAVHVEECSLAPNPNPSAADDPRIAVGDGALLRIFS
jgi:hypothetical protein